MCRDACPLLKSHGGSSWASGTIRWLRHVRDTDAHGLRPCGYSVKTFFWGILRIPFSLKVEYTHILPESSPGSRVRPPPSSTCLQADATSKGSHDGDERRSGRETRHDLPRGRRQLTRSFACVLRPLWLWVIMYSRLERYSRRSDRFLSVARGIPHPYLENSQKRRVSHTESYVISRMCVVLDISP